MEGGVFMEQVGPPDSAVIFLHGFEDSTEGISIICRRIAHFLPSTRFIVPQAPVNKTGQTAWYLPKSMTPDGETDQHGIEHSMLMLKALVKDQVECGIDIARIVIGGFSQGGSIAALYALQSESDAPKCFLLGSFIPDTTIDSGRRNGRGTLMVGHSMGDPLVSISTAEQTELRFRAHGFDVDFFRYPGMQHAITDQMQAHLSMFLLKVLGKP